MDKEKANKILKVYGNPITKMGKTKVIFARQDKEDVNEIEKMKDKDLINAFKELTFVNCIYGCVSLNELQRMDLLGLEIESRGIFTKEEYDEWYSAEERKFEESEGGKNK